MNMIFDHTSIRTRNIEKSINFYTKLIGLKLVGRRQIPQNNAEIAFLTDPQKEGSTLEITFYHKQTKFEQPEYENRIFDHLAFITDNMQKTIETLRKNKVTITDEPYQLAPGGTTIAFIEDPDGTLIELVERKK
jgi:lactoylglutathione lyase